MWNAFDRNLVSIRGDGQNLLFERYNVDWASMGSVSLQFSGLPWHDIIGIWDVDPRVLLAVRHDSDPDFGHVLEMDGMLFATGGLGTPLLSTEGAAIPWSGDIEWQTLGYTNEGFAAFRRSPIPQYYLFNEFGAEIGVVSPEIPEEKRPYNQRHVYGRTSGWYIMNMKEMSIERRAWWWK